MEELEGLHQELDVSDPTGPFLQVRLDVAPGAAALVFDANLHRTHGLRHPGINETPKREGGDRPLEGAGGRFGSRDEAQSDQHLTLPLHAERLVVVERGIHRVGKRTLRPLGPQVEVDPIGEALLGGMLQSRLEGADETRHLRVSRRFLGFALCVIQKRRSTSEEKFSSRLPSLPRARSVAWATPDSSAAQPKAAPRQRSARSEAPGGFRQRAARAGRAPRCGEARGTCWCGSRSTIPSASPRAIPGAPLPTGPTLRDDGRAGAQGNC